jgi:hypothetical protein
LSAAEFADTLIWRARQKPLYAAKIQRQLLAPRIFAGSLGRAMHRLVFVFGFHDHCTDDGLKFEQFHLRVGDLFAARSILLDPYQAQTLF